MAKPIISSHTRTAKALQDAALRNTREGNVRGNLRVELVAPPAVSSDSISEPRIPIDTEAEIRALFLRLDIGLDECNNTAQLRLQELRKKLGLPTTGSSSKERG